MHFLPFPRGFDLFINVRRPRPVNGSNVVILERSEWVWGYSYRVWRVKGWPRDPTHEVGITHTLEHMSESINNTI